MKFHSDVFLIGITGGVASGKSTFSDLMRRSFSIPVFDSDEAARWACLNDKKVIMGVASVMPDVIRRDGKSIDRKLLAQSINDSRFELAQKHIIAGVFAKLRIFIKTRAQRIIAAEIPLMFELGWDVLCDCKVVVYSNNRRARFNCRGNDLVNFDVYEKKQIPIEQKMQLADYIVCNDLSKQFLYEQAFHVLKNVGRSKPSYSFARYSNILY